MPDRPPAPDKTIPGPPAPGTTLPTATTVPTVTAPAATAPATTAPAVTSSPATSPGPAIGAVVDVGDAKPARDYDSYLAAALADIQSWWTTQYPALFGDSFRPLSGGIYAAYPERTSKIPACGGSESSTTYQEVSDYGAFYCDQGDFMAYDDGAQGVLAQLADSYGPSVVAVVLAHEFGHAIQGRTGDLDRNEPTVYTEQQADCFSGAWSAHVWRGETPTVSFTDEDVRTAMIALVTVRDPLGTSVYDDGGHGSAFDRIGAFQTGFIGGATDCKDLIDHPLPLLPNQFKGTQESVNQGDAPFDRHRAIVQADLNTFWPAQLAALGRGTMPTITARSVSDPTTDNCGEESALKKEVAIYCAASHEVLVDAVQARTLYDDFGDFAVGFVVGRAWAEAAQEALGSTLAGETRSLIDDCLVGGWVTGAIDWADSGPSAPSIPTLPGLADRTATMSPGDLDEAVQTALVLGDETMSENVEGSAFEQVAWLRIGVLDTAATCVNHITT